MFCQKCGKENEDGSQFCLYCGAALVPSNNTELNNNVTMSNNVVTKKKKKKWWIIPLVLCVCIVGVLFMCLIGGNEASEEAQDTIAKLDKMTDVTCKEDRYLFNYKDKWVININADAQTVKIMEKEIYNCISSSMESDDIGNDGEFIFNWGENKMYAQVDCEDKDGHISIIQYSSDDKKWTLMLNGEWYELSKDFQKYIDDYGLLEIMQNDVKSFESDLETVELSVDDLENVSYDEVVEYYKDHPLENVQESETEEKQGTDTEIETGDDTEKQIESNTSGMSPYDVTISFYQNNDPNKSGEMKIEDCYVSYDSLDNKIIVVKVHFKNTGNTDLDVSQVDFSLYGDNQLIDPNDYSVDYFRGTISSGREIEGEFAYSADPDQFKQLELEFADQTIELKNNQVDVFENSLLNKHPEVEKYLGSTYEEDGISSFTFNMDGTITYKNFSTEEEIIYNDYEFSDGYLHLHNQQKDFDLYCDDYNNCFAGDGGIVYDKVY